MANKYHVLKMHKIKNKNMQKKNDTYSPHMDVVISLIRYQVSGGFFWDVSLLAIYFPKLLKQQQHDTRHNGYQKGV